MVLHGYRRRHTALQPIYITSLVNTPHKAGSSLHCGKLATRYTACSGTGPGANLWKSIVKILTLAKCWKTCKGRCEKFVWPGRPGGIWVQEFWAQHIIMRCKWGGAQRWLQATLGGGRAGPPQHRYSQCQCRLWSGEHQQPQHSLHHRTVNSWELRDKSQEPYPVSDRSVLVKTNQPIIGS